MGKRGPKPKDGKRMANGRLSRNPAEVAKRMSLITEREQRDALSTGMLARHRLFGLMAEDLLNADAGSFVGRLHLTGEIDKRQCAAANEYLRIYTEMQFAVAGPKPAGAADLNPVKGLPGPENVQRSVQAMEAWKSALKALQHHQDELRGGSSLIAALDYCVLRDETHHHMIGWLRQGLNCLARHFKIEDRDKSPQEAA